MGKNEFMAKKLYCVLASAEVSLPRYHHRQTTHISANSRQHTINNAHVSDYMGRSIRSNSDDEERKKIDYATIFGDFPG